MSESFRRAAFPAAARRQLQRATEWVLPFEAQNLRFGLRELAARPQLHEHIKSVIRELKGARDILVVQAQKDEMNAQLWEIGFALRDYNKAVRAMKTHIAVVKEAGKGRYFAQGFNITALPLQARNRMSFSCEAVERVRDVLVTRLNKAVDTVGAEQFAPGTRCAIRRHVRSNERRGTSKAYDAFMR